MIHEPKSKVDMKPKEIINSSYKEIIEIHQISTWWKMQIKSIGEIIDQLNKWAHSKVLNY